MQAKGAGSSVGVERTARPCVSGSGDTAEVCGVRVHGLPEGQTGASAVPTIRKPVKRYGGRQLWARGYCVSTVGLDEEKIRKYVQLQEKQEKRAEQCKETRYSKSTPSRRNGPKATAIGGGCLLTIDISI